MSEEHDYGKEQRIIGSALVMYSALKAIADPTTRTDGEFGRIALQRFQAIARAAIAHAEGRE